MSGASKELKLRAVAYAAVEIEKAKYEGTYAEEHRATMIEAFRDGALSERAKLRRQGQLLVSNTDAWPASKVRTATEER